MYIIESLYNMYIMVWMIWRAPISPRAYLYNSSDDFELKKLPNLMYILVWMIWRLQKASKP